MKPQDPFMGGKIWDFNNLIWGSLFFPRSYFEISLALPYLTLLVPPALLCALSLFLLRAPCCGYNL
ncbi:hypothetical protein CW304_32625 [Bacillus sp. UFRGS-B20]|nr:hypothetical protein CW304_32625 [Bacillus sp. UFRGS-B20]